MNDFIERRHGERRSEGSKGGILESGDRRSGKDRRSNQYERMQRIQCEREIDDSVAKMRGRELMKFETMFNEITNRAKGKLNLAWSKYENGLAAVETETDPVQAKTIMEMVRDNLKDAVESIKSEMENELKLGQMK